MARVYKPIGPSTNKAATPVGETKKPPEKPQKKQKEPDGQ